MKYMYLVYSAENKECKNLLPLPLKHTKKIFLIYHYIQKIYNIERRGKGKSYLLASICLKNFNLENTKKTDCLEMKLKGTGVVRFGTSAGSLNWFIFGNFLHKQ